MLDDITTYLYNIPRFARTGGLIQTKKRLKTLGNPQHRFRYIHVAGTNGKGSVCAYLDSVIRQMGYKVGMFTSPHLVKINERIRIDGEEISDSAFRNAFQKVKSVIDDEADDIVRPTFFEYIYLIAMTAFAEAGIEYGIIETGLGGRLDLTNSIDHPELTVITSIGLDHTQILGDTYAKIAKEKAGIIKPETPLIFLDERKEVSDTILSIANVNKVPYTVVHPTQIRLEKADRNGLLCTFTSGNGVAYSLHLNTTGLYQLNNAAVAVTALEILFREMSPEYRKKMILAGMETMRWPARMEEMLPGVYIDGAHNDDGIRELARSISYLFENEKIDLLFAVAEDKDYTHMVRRLSQIKNLQTVIVTEIDNGRRTDHRIVEALFKDVYEGPVISIPNVNEALKIGLYKREDHVLLCTGSLYLAGHIKEILGGRS